MQESAGEGAALLAGESEGCPLIKDRSRVGGWDMA